jgi:FixJ family two-component response regulator
MAQVTDTIQIGIIDDDASVGRALARLLRGHGYDCIVFQSGESALAVLKVRWMHCLIIDIQMGGMNGFELCGKLDAAGVYIPHIFISAYIDAERSEMTAQFDDTILLIKPIDENELLASIERTLGRSHS